MQKTYTCISLICSPLPSPLPNPNKNKLQMYLSKCGVQVIFLAFLERVYENGSYKWHAFLQETLDLK